MDYFHIVENSTHKMIKGLLNILGVKAGETVLAPMAGSGTTNIDNRFTWY